LSSGYDSRHITKQRPKDDSVSSETEKDKPIFDIINRLIPPYALDNPRKVTVEDWRSETASYKDARVFRSILRSLGIRNLYDAGQSYIDMIKKYEPQILTPFNEIHILKFFLDCNRSFEPLSNEKDIEYIVSTFKKVRKAFPVLESFSAEVLLLAMQKTPQWRLALELLDDLSLLYKVFDL